MAADASRQTGPTDAELLDRTRSGDDDAFAQLYQRYVDVALRYAGSFAKQPAEAEDLAVEAFIRVLRVLRAGNGPRTTLLPCLLTLMRRAATDTAPRDQRVVPSGDVTALTPPLLADDPAIAEPDRTLAARAFMSLPERWQSVLWYTEVEGQRPARLAPILGIDAAAVAALAYRAREGLRQAYLQAHVTMAAESCRPFARHLGEYVRGGLGSRNSAKLKRHLASCEDCHAAHAELLALNTSTSAVIAPAVLGAAVAAKPAATAAGATVTTAAHAGATQWIIGQFAKRTRSVAATTASATLSAAVAFGMVGHVNVLRSHQITATTTGRHVISQPVTSPSPRMPGVKPTPAWALAAAPRPVPITKPRPTPISKPSPSPRPTPSPKPTRPPAPTPAPHACPQVTISFTLRRDSSGWFAGAEVDANAELCVPSPISRLFDAPAPPMPGQDPNPMDGYAQAINAARWQVDGAETYVARPGASGPRWSR